ncbi:MAG: murein biosynthesis integral membrane protein MurJ [Anaerolineae bacterium]
MIEVKRIIQATTVVTLISLVVKGLGFLEKILLAYFFGTGIEVDAYLVAYSIPFSAYIVLREVVKPSFLPTFLRLRQRSEQDGGRLFITVGMVLFIFLGLATVGGVFLADSLVSLAAPGFDDEQRLLTVRLVRIVIPAMFLLGLSTLTTAALHAEKRFVLPAMGEASFRAGPLVLLGLLGGVQAMACGVVLGTLGKLGLEMAGLRKSLRQVRPILDLASEPVRTVGRLAAPLLVALSLSLFVGPLVENAFASQVGVGGVSALAYARKIAETLTTLLPYALGLVLLPFSAEMVVSKNLESLAMMVRGAVRALVLLFLPLTIGLMVFRKPFVQLLFERGAFDAASTQLTIGPLLFYALALLPFALEVVIVQFFFAHRDTLTPVITDMVTFALNVALIPPLMAIYGLGGIALAATIAKTVKVLALLFLFHRRVPAFRLRPFAPFAGQMILASLAAAAVFLAAGLAQERFWGGIGQELSSNPVVLAAYLAISGALGGGIFYAVAYWLRVDEIRSLQRRAVAWGQALIRSLR